MNLEKKYVKSTNFILVGGVHYTEQELINIIQLNKQYKKIIHDMTTINNNLLQGLTGKDDTDIFILKTLNYNDLYHACYINKNFYNLCEKDKELKDKLNFYINTLKTVDGLLSTYDFWITFTKNHDSEFVNKLFGYNINAKYQVRIMPKNKNELILVELYGLDDLDSDSESVPNVDVKYNLLRTLLINLFIKYPDINVELG